MTAAAAPSDIPRGKILDENLDGARRAEQIIFLERFCDQIYEFLLSGQEPLIDYVLLAALALFLARPVVGVRISDKIRINIPQYQLPTAHYGLQVNFGKTLRITWLVN